MALYPRCDWLAVLSAVYHTNPPSLYNDLIDALTKLSEEREK